MHKYLRFIFDIAYRFNVLNSRGLFKRLSDKRYLMIAYKSRFHRKLDLVNPKTFNEKLQWLKLYDRKDEYTQMVDKYEVKSYVARRIGSEYVIPTIAIGDSFDEIDFNVLPNSFVIKCTHDSGSAVICKDKETIDNEAVRAKLSICLQRNYYNIGREWPYKNVRPRIIVDAYLDDHTGKELRDYKWWCFNGHPRIMYCTIKGDNIYENFYDMNFQPVMIDHGFPRHIPEFERPVNFEIMRDLATKLAKDIPFVRVDFFDVEGKVYFSEFTFYDWGGMKPFGADWDERLGDLIPIPNK